MVYYVINLNEFIKTWKTIKEKIISNKAERTTKDWIKLDGTNILILCGGVRVPPIFLNYLLYICLLKFLLVAILIFHANCWMQKLLLRGKSLPFIACFSYFIHWSFMGVKNLLKLDIFWKSRLKIREWRHNYVIKSLT